MPKSTVKRDFINLTTVFYSAFNFSQSQSTGAEKPPIPTQYEFTPRRFVFAVLILASGLLTLTGCNSGNPRPPAPVGDLATLEKLAESYKATATNIPTNPVNMRPEARRKFLEQVFENAGYDYSRTLLALAQTESDNITQHHSDLRELLFLPHYGMKLEDMKDVYSKEEFQAIKQINKHFK